MTTLKQTKVDMDGLRNQKRNPEVISHLVRSVLPAIAMAMIAAIFVCRLSVAQEDDWPIESPVYNSYFALSKDDKVQYLIASDANPKIKVSASLDMSRMPETAFGRLAKSGALESIDVIGGRFEAHRIKEAQDVLRNDLNRNARLRLSHTKSILFDHCSFEPIGIDFTIGDDAIAEIRFEACVLRDNSDRHWSGKESAAFFTSPRAMVKNLQFNDTYLGEHRVDWSAAFPSVEKLGLDHAGIGDKDLVEIAKLKYLQNLDVRGNNISNASIPLLTELAFKKGVVIAGLHRNLLSKEWLKANAAAGVLRKEK